MRYGLLTLLGCVAVAAIVFAVLPRESAIVPALRRDLKIPSRYPIWILDESKPDRVVAVTDRDQRYTLFAAYRGWARKGEWVIPFAVGSGAPHDEPEDVIEDSVGFDHFPTDEEIALFCSEYRIDGYP